MEGRPGEGVEPRPLGIFGNVEQPDRGNHHVELLGAPVGQLDIVEVARLVPCRADDRRTELDSLTQAVIVHGFVDIGFENGLRSVRLGPVEMLEPIRIPVGKCIDLGSRIGVLVPDSTETMGPFVDRYIVKAGLAEIDRGGNPAEARPDDGDAKIVTGRRGRRAVATLQRRGGIDRRHGGRHRSLQFISSI